MKSGFVALIGRSNVGKSTLLNTLVGTKIAATSFRPQMTRHEIHGVITTPDGQAVFVDTPGVFKDQKNLLSAKLVNKVKNILEQELDLIIYVVDPSREIGQEERAAFGMVRHLNIPKLLVINKCDLPARERPFEADYEAWGKEFDGVFKLSALRASHIKPLKEKVMELLPEGEPMYPEEQWTNIDNYFWIAEIIREKIFSVFEKEIPYAISVEVDNVEEKPEITVISARILTNQERYKKIIIGRGGQKIKEVGKLARRELEAALNTKIYLELEVEVDKHWIERV
ncbi:MAG: GTPase Era [Candidatus Magasanikbacteria bacterium]|nr:GTPase Era [Candidatus Magasanikbacteria bacterium]